MSNSRDAIEVLHALAPVMTRRKLPWFLFGAQAAIIWGSRRLSNDVDVTVTIDRKTLRDFIAAMQKQGFEPEFRDDDFIDRARVIPFVHRPTRMPLDVVLAGPGLEDEFLKRAISVDVDGRKIPVVSPEDLIISKVLAGRAKDVEDIKHVIARQHKTLDVHRIRTMLELLEKALSQSDLLPVFEKAWQTAAE